MMVHDLPIQLLRVMMLCCYFLNVVAISQYNLAL